MSVGSAFYTALSGLDTNGMAMGVMGDNIANINTTGYKSSSIFFADVLGMSLTGVSGGNRVGAGAKTQAVDVTYNQGTFRTTGSGTDVAVNGSGFLVVNNPGDGAQYYTRDGHLEIDNEGYYVNSQGYRLQGYKYGLDATTGDYTLEETLGDIQVSANGINPPVPTSKVTLKMNLDAGAEVKVPGWTWASPAAPPGPDQYNFSAPVTVYDTLGDAHIIQVYFVKTVGGTTPTWQWHALIDGADVDGGTAGIFQEYGSGTTDLVFNPDTGELDPPVPAEALNTASLTFKNGATSDTPSAPTIDFTGTVSFSSPSQVQDLSQNGFPAGSATSVGIDEFGNVVAAYSNGTNKPLFRIALATFSSLNGLERKGLTLYQSTLASGDPMYGKPGDGSYGKINATMLEEANVDLATEMIRMIVVQRAYQANAKVITMADEMMQAVQNIR